jgi:hypothetical protein
VADPRYLVRLDDACPWRDRGPWDRLEALFDRLGVRPLVAVIPDCRDPEVRPGTEDPAFWQRVRGWKAKGWALALHGHTHELGPCGSSLVPLNRYTEFAGRPEAEQRAKIRSGWGLMTAEAVAPDWWVAPAHTFDRTTLKVLTEETSIRRISDGLSNRAFVRHGFSWVPQQLWRPRSCPDGLWTLCLHPNDHTPAFEARLEAFLTEHQAHLATWDTAVSDRPWGGGDGLFEASFRTLRFVKRMLKK